MQHIRKAIIPAAGFGTRLLPATKSQPKEMLPVGRKPCVQHIVEELVSEGVEQILFVTGQGKTAIENHFDRVPELERQLLQSGRFELLREVEFKSPVRFFYTRQGAPNGLGDAVLHGKEFAGDAPHLVALGDSIIAGSVVPGLVRRMCAAFFETGADAVLAVQLVEPSEVHRYGIVAPAGGVLTEIPFTVSHVVEKPSPANAPSRFAIAGRYVFSPRIFDALERTVPQRGGEVQLTDAIQILINQGAKVVAVPLEGDEVRYDIGNFADYFKTFIRFAAEDPEYGPQVREEMARILGGRGPRAGHSQGGEAL